MGFPALLDVIGGGGIGVEGDGVGNDEGDRLGFGFADSLGGGGEICRTICVRLSQDVVHTIL